METTYEGNITETKVTIIIIPRNYTHEGQVREQRTVDITPGNYTRRKSQKTNNNDLMNLEFAYEGQVGEQTMTKDFIPRNFT